MNYNQRGRGTQSTYAQKSRRRQSNRGNLRASRYDYSQNSDADYYEDDNYVYDNKSNEQRGDARYARVNRDDYSPWEGQGGYENEYPDSFLEGEDYDKDRSYQDDWDDPDSSRYYPRRMSSGNTRINFREKVGNHYQQSNPIVEYDMENYRRSGPRFQPWDSNYNEGRTNDAGQFKGKGPKGYKRSDERILEDINQALYDHSMIDASEIEVRVENGDVILSGNIYHKQDKRRAEDIADSVSGVHNVENRLRLKQGSSGHESVSTSSEDIFSKPASGKATASNT